MKCNDLLFYMMRHFSVEFNLDEEGIPRQWPNMKPEQITELYVFIYDSLGENKIKILRHDPQLRRV